MAITTAYDQGMGTLVSTGQAYIGLGGIAMRPEANLAREDYERHVALQQAPAEGRIYGTAIDTAAKRAQNEMRNSMLREALDNAGEQNKPQLSPQDLLVLLL